MVNLSLCLSYERFEDKAVEVYDRQGNSLVFVPKLGDADQDFDLLRRSVTRQLVAMSVSTDAWAKVGIFNQDLPFFQLEEAQAKRIREASAFHGHLPCIPQAELAKALGMSGSAISYRTSHGLLEAFQGPRGKLIAWDSLTKEDQERVETYEMFGAVHDLATHLAKEPNRA